MTDEQTPQKALKERFDEAVDVYKDLAKSKNASEIAINLLMGQLGQQIADDAGIDSVAYNSFVALEMTRKHIAGAEVDIQLAEVTLRKVANEMAVEVAATFDNINTMPSKAFGDKLPWLTVRKTKVFTVTNRKTLAKYLLDNNREDLIDIGGSVADKNALIKSGLLPKDDKGNPLMIMTVAPGVTISTSTLIKGFKDVDSSTTGDE